MNRTEFVEDTLVPWDELPPEVRAAIGPCLPQGHSVFACPSRDGRGGVVVEWWWLNAQHELVEAFWFE